MNRRILAALTTAVLLAGAAGCGGDGDDGGTGGDRDTLTIGTVVQLDSLDPLSPTGGSYPYQQLVHEYLIGYDRETLEMKPTGLATAWEFTGPEKRTFEITLRPGVRFSNGEAADAEAVKASLLRYKAKGVLNPLTAIESIDVVSPTELKINLAYEFAPLLEYLALDGGLIVAPATVAAKPDSDAGDQAIGAGPYKLKEHRPGISASFVPNENYWDQANAAKLEQIDVRFFKDGVSMMNALRTGQVDLTNRVPPKELGAFEGDARYTVYKRTSIGIDHVYFNWDKPALADPRVRLAVNYAMDRDALNQVMTEGVGTPGHQAVPKGTPLYTDELTGFTYDPAKARQLLADAGKAGGVTLDCVAQPGTGWDQLAPVFIDQLEQVGITLNVKQISVAESTATYFKPNTADCFLGGWVGFISLQGTLYGISDSKSFYTPAQSDTGFDAIIARYNSAYTTAEKKAVTTQWHEQALVAPANAIVSNRAKVAIADADVAGYEHGLLTAEFWRNLHWKSEAPA